MHLAHAFLHVHTYIHRLAAITVTMRLVHVSNKRHTHASPRSNDRDHAPCTSPNTNSHTCMHRLAAIAVSMCNTHSHTCMHRLAAITLSIPSFTHTHMHASPRSNHPEHTLIHTHTHTHRHTHASPRSNHSEHAPCASPNTHSHIHAHIASQQSP